MANKEIKNYYKRSSDHPLVISDEHKKAISDRNKTATIIKYALIALILLSIIFSILPVISVNVTNADLDTYIGDKDKTAGFSGFGLIGAWFEKSSFSYADRNINVGYQYPHVIDYIVDHVPALNAAINFGDIGADAVFGAITAEQDAQLDLAYIIMLVIEIVSIVWLIALAVIAALSFVKKYRPSQTIVNVSILIHLAITFLMFVMTLILSASSTADFAFVIGVGMWLNLLIALCMTVFVIFNMVFAAKVKSYEKENM